MGRMYRLFSSPILALLLLLVFAVSMGVATFIENDFGIPTSWKLVYNALWFELVMLGLGVCFLFNISKYRLWRKVKWPILMFHLAFILILIGAAITRYHSESGIMRIREGNSSNHIISDASFLTAQLTDDKDNKIIKKELDLSLKGDNTFEIKETYKGKTLSISYLDYLIDAEAVVVDDHKEGEPLLEVVISDGSEKKTVILKKGEVEAIGAHQHLIGFESNNRSAVNIYEESGIFKIMSPDDLDFFIMASQNAGRIAKDSIQNIHLKTLFRWHDVSFVPNTFHKQGKIDLISAQEQPKDNDELKDDVLQVRVQYGSEEKTANLLYRNGFIATTHTLDMNTWKLSLSYGADSIVLPFALRLTDFQLERYPGSSSPSSYASEVEILDGNNTIPYRIYMNNVLDHSGYRFYQASYDTDELGTVLAVNKDALGTWITYLGYLFMGIGMLFTLFGRTSRFRLISSKLKKLKKNAVLGILFLASFSAYAQVENQNEIVLIDQGHAEAFGQLFVQDLDGRIKPINTLASEFLRKLSGKPYLMVQNQKWTADQAFLAMHTAPNDWRDLPIIKMDKDKLAEHLPKLSETKSKLYAFGDFLDSDGNYLLSREVELANQKKPAERNETDKELIKVDERFNILFNVLSGNYLKLFPNKNDPNNTWFTHTYHFNDFPTEDAQFARGIMPLYFSDIINQNYTSAAEKLSYIHVYQNTLAEAIVPSEQKLNAELWYNKLNINFWMFQAFFSLGGILLLLSVVKVLTSKKWISLVWNLFFLLVLVAFLVLSGNLILRWYIAGHAPWSNGYEMLVFVSWALLFSGLLSFRKSIFALPLATLFSGALLFVSYLDWLNPEITNLMPVLKSYWLKIHVATIVSSYAPLALGAVLGMMALILFLFKNKQNHVKIEKHILELTYMNELLLTIGLFLLAVGTFLGGVWANESWGRYWAWDPKETWALISIIVYAIVLHLRFVPKLNNYLVFNSASMFAFWSIIMTSFGVNYYLTGLHSYATGDPIPIPTFIYVLVAIMLMLSIGVSLKKHWEKIVD
ncbi:cytochrome c biogenesis protein CcsA [Muricauda sp. 2012CJ35-5]|uniref:Cytochrome c biogenesis protein CcsA n=1 Tax=Flagellimonas spongiicola TaxID=2942208 RepID=A0ABT0PT48_9FLAO|nr:cytochrome c biogenesis protein CcsA [Allomuricauda spongiicola]MCL6274534.1 cytochrome c biogenesis protein CcsA [Allomuricauda spongiicola]